QLSVLLGLVAFCLNVGISGLTIIVAVLAYAFCCVLLGLKMWRATSTPNPLEKGSLLLLLMYVGIFITFGGLIALGGAFFIRFGNAIVSWLFCGMIFIMALLLFLVGFHSTIHQSTPWFQFGVGVIATPVLIAWLIGTLASGISHSLSDPLPLSEMEHLRKQELSKRAAWANHLGWLSRDRRPISVAV